MSDAKNSPVARRSHPEGMTFVELLVVLAILGGLGWFGALQLTKLRMRVKAIEVKVLVREVDQTFESHVAEHGLTLPHVSDEVPLASYAKAAQAQMGELPHLPKGESETFDFWLGSDNDYWKLTVLEKDKGDDGFIMTCGYQFTSKGWVEVNANNPWAYYLRPTCLVADKPRHN